VQVLYEKITVGYFETDMIDKHTIYIYIYIYIYVYIFIYICIKGKMIPLQARCGPEGG